MNSISNFIPRLPKIFRLQFNVLKTERISVEILASSLLFEPYTCFKVSKIAGNFLNRARANREIEITSPIDTLCRCQFVAGCEGRPCCHRTMTHCCASRWLRTAPPRPQAGAQGHRCAWRGTRNAARPGAATHTRLIRVWPVRLAAKSLSLALFWRANAGPGGVSLGGP